MKKLKGKTVLITGAAGGIGTELAWQLLREFGCHLYLVDLNEKALNALVAQMRAEHPKQNIEPIIANLCDAQDIARIAQTVTQLDVLINNAGVVYAGSFATMDEQRVDNTIAVNLMATIDLTRALLPQLLRQTEAHIVNVASGAGLIPAAGMAAYVASKFGVVGFSQSLRVELQSKGIGVSVICPAFVQTDIIRNSIGQTQNATQAKQVDNLDKLVHQVGISPKKMATGTLRAIRCNKAVVKVDFFTRGTTVLQFFAPSLARWVNGKVYQQLIKRGSFE